jgi:DNA-binding CsgD family transcriptional regulator
MANPRRQRNLTSMPSPVPGAAPSEPADGRADLLDHIAAVVRRLLDTDYSKIFEAAPTGATLLLRAGAGWRPGHVGTTTVPGGSGSPAGHTVATGTPIIVADCTTERRCAIPPLLRAHGVRSAVVVPIRAGTKVYGALGVDSITPRTFTTNDVRLLEAFADIVAAALPPRPDPRLYDLSHREREVLRLLAHGYANREIAARLDVSVKTVETYRTRLSRKLRVHTRHDLVRLALHAGLLDASA